jgi:uncharacterized protein (TIGR00255 family)
MTAYASAMREEGQDRWVVEIHSVNRKGLDIFVHLPKELIRFDVPVRKWVSEELARGQVTVRVHKMGEQGSADYSVSFLQNLKSSWEQIARELGYDAKQIDLKFLVEQASRKTQELVSDDTSLFDVLKEITQAALHELIAMKKREGAALKGDIEMRLGLIEEARAQVEKKAFKTPERHRERLHQRIREEVPLTPEAEERLARELILFAEKIDITEEITRLQSHRKQFEMLLASQEKSVGRTLDFMVQEMNREINTIASKSLDAEISALAVTMKSECEKIREQIQNIE